MTPEMSRALRHFAFSRKEAPLELINRLAQHWAARLSQKIPRIGESTPVRAERWSHVQVGEHIDRMAAICPEMLVSSPPRHDVGALVLFELADGSIGQLDGRHRANLWRHCSGEYDVLILELKCAS